MFSTKIKPLNSSADLNWSIRPLLVWMRFISIDLLNSEMDSTFLCRWIRLIYRYIAWLSTIVVHFSIILFLFMSKDSALQQWARISTWNLLIDVINMAVRCIGVHSSTHFILTNNWNSLYQSLVTTNELQPQLNYLKMRHLSIIGVVYVILTDTTLFILFVVLDVPEVGYRPTVLMHLGLAIWIKIYTSTTTLFFCILCWILAAQINYIRQQVTVLALFNSPIKQGYVVMKLRKQYSKISQSVDLLNDCFGSILMIEIPCIFIGVINSSMHLILNANQDNGSIELFSIMYFINYFVSLLLICLSADKIRKEAKQLSSALFCLSDEDNPDLKLEIQSFTTQLFQTEFVLSGCGFFRVDKYLIPKLIQTTLTYLLIMIQFYTSETKTSKAPSN